MQSHGGVSLCKAGLVPTSQMSRMLILLELEEAGRAGLRQAGVAFAPKDLRSPRTCRKWSAEAPKPN